MTALIEHGGIGSNVRYVTPEGSKVRVAVDVRKLIQVSEVLDRGVIRGGEVLMSVRELGVPDGHVGIR